MPVYLLHFSRKYHHAQHYIGWAKKVKKRVEHHRNGTGARLMQVIVQAGIDFEVAREWDDGDKTFERRLKKQKKASKLCPICRAARKGTPQCIKPGEPDGVPDDIPF